MGGDALGISVRPGIATGTDIQASQKSSKVSEHQSFRPISKSTPSRDLSEQAKDIKAQQQRGERERPLDAEGLRRCYSRIETSFRQLQASARLMPDDQG